MALTTYTAKDWALDDDITEVALDHMEQGIKSVTDEVLGTDVHIVGGAGEPAFTNSWVNFGSYGGKTYGAAKFKLIGDRVYLQGMIKSGTMQQAAFTLPAAYRPPVARQLFTISNNAIGRIDVNVDGTVVPYIGNNAWVMLDGVSFDL